MNFPFIHSFSYIPSIHLFVNSFGQFIHLFFICSIHSAIGFLNYSTRSIWQFYKACMFSLSHSSINSLIHSFKIHPYIHSNFIHTFIRTFIQNSSIHSSIYTSIHPFIYLHIHSSIHLSTHSFIHSSIYTFVCIFIHKIIVYNKTSVCWYMSSYFHLHTFF